MKRLTVLCFVLVVSIVSIFAENNIVYDFSIESSSNSFSFEEIKSELSLGYQLYNLEMLIGGNCLLDSEKLIDTQVFIKTEINLFDSIIGSNIYLNENDLSLEEITIYLKFSNR